MSSWRDHILKEFTPKVARLTLVVDPDGLLLEERILEGVRDRGFEMIPFEDHIAFRYAYELRFRARWDRGESTDLVVLLRSEANDLSALPYDLLQAGRKLSFNLGDIFPNLSYPVVATLDRGDLDAVYEAQRRYAPGQLGDNATKEFVLRHVFGIAPELIKQPSDLLRVLLRRHYRGQRIPSGLDDRFVHLLEPLFEEWPLRMLVSDREAFFAFLQERWAVFLDREAARCAGLPRGEETPHGLDIAGPVDLPFDHHDIRVYIDNLFVEGLLKPVLTDHVEALSRTWVGIGIFTAPAEDGLHRLRKLIDSLQASLPTSDARHTDWLTFARGWAELALLLNELSGGVPADAMGLFDSLRIEVDAEFASWLTRRYAGLVNLPPVPPVMLHHLPRFLAHQVGEDRNARVAMIVMDGLALDQWLQVRCGLSSRRTDLRFREQAVFAWVPSLTAVSRQAAFAGKAPVYFPASIHTTDKEPLLWTQFWADQGLMPSEVLYSKGLGDGSLERLSDAVSHPKVRVIGLVVDKVDKMMHGMEMGASGMHSQVRQWATQPYLSALLDLLFSRGFSVYLTSDHGNVEAEGCGRPAEGAVADLRGERVRVYPDAVLRRRVKERYPASLEWEPAGLPENYLPLLAPSRYAFIQEGRRTVSHGGISVEELIVPLVQIERARK